MIIFSLTYYVYIYKNYKDKFWISFFVYLIDISSDIKKTLDFGKFILFKSEVHEKVEKFKVSHKELRMINTILEVLLSVDRVYKTIFSYLWQLPSKKISVTE